MKIRITKVGQSFGSCMLGLFVLGLTPSVPLAAGDAAQTRPDYHRRSDPSGRPEAAAPESIELPAGLVAAKKGQGQVRTEAKGQKDSTKTVQRRTPAAPKVGPRERRLDQLAWAAGRDAAAEAWRRRGMREYYRAGFVEGERDAIGRDGLGAWDYQLGLRDGLRDSAARSEGAARGSAAGARRAEGDAARAVEEAFRDLRQSPAPDHTADAPRFAGEPAVYPPPELRDVFRVLDFAPRVRLAELRGWRPDPWWLYQQSSWDRVLDRGWSEPDQVFSAWLERRGASKSYRSLRDRGERFRFGEVFRSSVRDYVTESLPALVGRVYRSGWLDGWEYGRLVNIEWSYRRGLHEGLVRAHQLAAAAAFTAAYPLAYRAAWSENWEDWNQRAQIEIEELRATDADGDGVFSPGEGVRLDCAVANYGGLDGSGQLVLAAGPYAADRQRLVKVPARSRQQIIACFEVALAQELRPRSQARLRVDLGISSVERRLRVAYPLELAAGAEWGEVRIVEGSAELLVPVRNGSRRTAEGEVRLFDQHGEEIARTAASSVSADGRRALSVDLDGLDPLELLAGQVGFELQLFSGEKLFDRRPLQLPGLALDLERVELVEYLLSLAARGGDPERFAALRGLVEDRLRRDWAVAVSRRGNPYRDDYRNRSSSTALGQLVEARRNLPRSAPGAHLFSELGESALQLSGDLPGWHPLLRKYLRRLARRLGGGS